MSFNSNWIGPEKGYNYNLPDNVLNESLAVTSVNECGDACSQYSNCKGFIIDDASTTCWLKSKMDTPVPNVPGANAYKMKNYTTQQTITGGTTLPNGDIVFTNWGSLTPANGIETFSNTENFIYYTFYIVILLFILFLIYRGVQQRYNNDSNK
jgi:hypothetical protein